MSTLILSGRSRPRLVAVACLIAAARRRAAWTIVPAMLTGLLCASSFAQSAELRVLSAAAVQSIFKEIAGDFERQFGHRLYIDYATMGAINQRVLSGETPDLVIGSGASIAGLVTAGRIRRDSEVRIAKVGIGIAVPRSDPKLEIRSVDDLVRALRSAKAIVYANPAGGGAAGIHIAKVIDKLGLRDDLQWRTKFGAGGDVTEVTVAQGAGALGMTQISEIVGKEMATFVGPMPTELQNYTGVSAGIPASVSPSEAAAAFVAFLKTPAAVAAFKAKGMEVD